MVQNGDRPGPEAILPSYEREAADWARGRVLTMWEAPALLAAVDGRAPGLRVLDLGCGSGEPIAAWFVRRGDRVTGVDGAAAMIAELRRPACPGQRPIHADMRGLALGRRFDVILAFNSVFHLSPDDQRAMFPVFAAHAAPGRRFCSPADRRRAKPGGGSGPRRSTTPRSIPAEYRACLSESRVRRGLVPAERRGVDRAIRSGLARHG
jgi:SAM-dependent methyltransferase